MGILKTVLFYPMLWLRGIFVRIGRLIAGILLLATIGLFFSPDIPWDKHVVIGALSFGTFLLCEFYDRILLKLSPNDVNYFLD